jgi:homoserine O-succinyltransferase
MNAMSRAVSPTKAPIKIGLVNNMSDAALLATERQFMRLIEPAARETEVHIRLFYLPEIARGDAARAQLHARYTPIEDLSHTGIDALIVTGCEPIRSNLADEPYWPSLSRLIDWAKDNTISTIWSCLAAHAAVLHLDGIERGRLPRKLAGVYEFDRASNHPLLRGVTEPVHVPHSRLNGLSSNDLARRGYEVLTHSADSGVDAFVKQYKSVFLFLQGHPEYEPESLYREYRRDMARFLEGQQDTCPALPDNYFDRKTSVLFAAFADVALAERKPALVKRFPALEKVRLSRADWATSSNRLFSNWILHIAETKARQAHPAREHVIV